MSLKQKLCYPLCEYTMVNALYKRQGFLCDAHRPKAGGLPRARREKTES